MAWKVSADPYQFDASVAWFRDRLPMTDDEWSKLSADARRKSFHVAGATTADVVTDVWKALDHAIEKGTTLADFKASVGAKLTSAWGGANPARLETVFRTNLQLAYSAGRQSEMLDPDIAEERPYRRFVATLDSATTPACRALHNTILPASDPSWTTRQPPLHHRCRSAVLTLTAEEAQELGVTKKVPTAEPAKGFGQPLADWNPDLGKYPDPIRDQLEEFFKHVSDLGGHSPMPSPSMPPPGVTPINSKRDLALPVPRKPKVIDASVILGEKVADATGSNEGGQFRGTDGKLRYVKFYKDPSQAYGEHLANQIYKGLGVAAPESVVFEHQGKLAYASEILPGVQTLGAAGLSPELARKVSKGFMADVLTANWDVVGLSHDNVVVDAKGNVIRIDNGGTFLMRAKAGRKATAVLNQVTELDGFFSMSRNAAYAKVMAKAGYEAPQDFIGELKTQHAAILKLREKFGGWEKFVAKLAPKLNAADRATIIGMLEARTTLLKGAFEVVPWENDGPSGSSASRPPCTAGQGSTERIRSTTAGIAWRMRRCTGARPRPG